MKKLIYFLILLISTNSFSQILGFKPGDTMRVVGFPRNEGVPAELSFWTDNDNLIHYTQSWKEKDTILFMLRGIIRIGKNGVLQAFSTRFFQNGVLRNSEIIEPVGDSVVLTKDGVRTGMKVKSGAVYLPNYINSALNAIITKSTLQLKQKSFLSSQYGMVRVRQVSKTTLTINGKNKKLFLYLLSADSVPDAQHIWLDEKQKLFAILYADNNWDFLPVQLKVSRDQLLQIEFLAAQANKKIPTCGPGFSFNNCEPGTFICKPTTRRTPGEKVATTLTLTDSSYSVRSDGLGSYVNNWPTIRIGIGIIGGMLINMINSTDSSVRYYSVDLNHPIPGDIGLPLGVIKASGWPGPFLPSGTIGGNNEISAQWYTEKYTASHPLFEIPIGKTVFSQQLVVDFYIDGLLHVLQMGPQSYGHCISTGSAIYGDGTTRGTITRETEIKWVIDLPLGSIGRLFDIHNGDRNAVNKGLYYVSLHYVIQ